MDHGSRNTVVKIYLQTENDGRDNGSIDLKEVQEMGSSNTINI